MMSPGALDDALLALRDGGQPAPAGRHPRRWPGWARRVVGVTVGGLRVRYEVAPGAPVVSLRQAAASLRRVLDRRPEAG